MKGEHLAKADFLRELKQLTRQLYELDKHEYSERDNLLLKSKINGFIGAGLLLQVTDSVEMQAVIDDCHFEVFSETRKERRERLAEANLSGSSVPQANEAWDLYDSPTFERRGNSKTAN